MVRLPAAMYLRGLGYPYDGLELRLRIGLLDGAARFASGYEPAG